MRAAVAGIVCLVLAGLLALLFGGDSTIVKALAVALIGVAGVVAVSLAFFVVGHGEDVEREAARKPPPDDETPPAKHETHERPALTRRRPLPPRRPS